MTISLPLLAGILITGAGLGYALGRWGHSAPAAATPAAPETPAGRKQETPVKGVVPALMLADLKAVAAGAGTMKPNAALLSLVEEALRMAHGNPQQTALGESLIAAEDIVFDAADRGLFQHCTLRPTVIAGRAGGFIDTLVTGILRGTSNLDLQRRMWDVMQWTHGSDLARAALLVAMHDGTANQCFTVAGDQPVTIYDIQSMLWDLLNIGRPGNAFAENAAMNNIGLPKFDATRLKSLGWVPQMTMRDCLAECLGRLEFHSSASLRMPPHMLDS